MMTSRPIPRRRCPAERATPAPATSPHPALVRAFPVALLVALGAPLAQAQPYAIAWSTIDGGGTMTASGGTYALSGTAGQPDAGVLAGGTYSVAGGFWGGAGSGSGIFEADLSATLTDSPDPVIGLGTVTYTIGVANAAGFDQANNLSVIQSFTSIPGSLAFLSATGSGWNCSAGTTTLTCTQASLVSGTSAPDLTTQWAVGPQGGTLSATAAVTASEADPFPADNGATTTTTVTGVPYADLFVSQTDGGVTVLWNQPLTYLITVSNAGPNGVTGATVTDTFSAFLSGVLWTCSASAGSSCTPSGAGNLADAAVTLLSGGSVTYMATGTVVYGTAGPIPNTVSVSASTFDPVSANNASTIQTPVDTDLIFKDGFQ